MKQNTPIKTMEKTNPIDPWVRLNPDDAMKNLKEYFAHDHFANHIGAHLVEITEGHATAKMTVGSMHLNAYGICQGGVLFTLCDLAFAAAVNSHGVSTLTTGANITYVNSAHEGDELTAEAQEIVNHHRMPYAEARITNQDGLTIAIFTASGYRK
jgi:acyl-CoA thioesterase